MGSIKTDTTVGGRVWQSRTPRAVLADFLDELGRGDEADALRSAAVVDISDGRVTTPALGVADILAHNGEPDAGPWVAAECPHVGGNDGVLALCADGVVWWSHRLSVWVEITPLTMPDWTRELIRNKQIADRLLYWMGQLYPDQMHD